MKKSTSLEVQVTTASQVTAAVAPPPSKQEIMMAMALKVQADAIAFNSNIDLQRRKVDEQCNAFFEKEIATLDAAIKTEGEELVKNWKKSVKRQPTLADAYETSIRPGLDESTRVTGYRINIEAFVPYSSKLIHLKSEAVLKRRELECLRSKLINELGNPTKRGTTLATIQRDIAYKIKNDPTRARAILSDPEASKIIERTLKRLEAASASVGGETIQS